MSVIDQYFFTNSHSFVPREKFICKYKCRNCGNEYLEEEPFIGKPVSMSRLLGHKCDDGFFGVSELIGYRKEANERNLG